MRDDWEKDIVTCIKRFKNELEEIVNTMPKDAFQTDAGEDAVRLTGKLEAMLEWME